MKEKRVEGPWTSVSPILFSSSTCPAQQGSSLLQNMSMHAGAAGRLVQDWAGDGGNMGEGIGCREAGAGCGQGHRAWGGQEEGTGRAWQHEVPQDRLF